MNRQIAELLKTEIATSGLNWLDQVSGMVEPLQNKVKKGDSNIVKTEPVYRKPFQAGCNVNNDYETCIPRTEKKSVIYIEAEDCQRVNETIRYQEYTLKLSVVCWLNLKQINPAYEDAGIFINELLSVVKSSLPNSAPYNTIRVDFGGVKRDLGTVNKYDYDEAETQLWIYPFDFFVAEFDVTFRRYNVCRENVVLNPQSCKTY
jgi:hypothetical protein